MNVRVSIICFLFYLNTSFGQSLEDKRDSIPFQKEAVFCKVWGFLKYYHPNVARGKYNWDEQFLTQLPLIQKAKNKEEISLIYLNWIISLGDVKKQNISEEKEDSKYFTKNLDLAWLGNEHYFNAAVVEKLQFIKNNRYQGKPFYVDRAKTGNILMINEKMYKEALYPETNMRILNLCRYWNTVEYFFPYKYMTDQKWEDVLPEMIGKFVLVKNELDYNLAMLETVVKTDDAHGVFITDKTAGFFGQLFFPATLKIIEGKAIVTGIPNDSLAKINDLKVGDIIEEIDGVPIATIIKNKLKYLSGSNKDGKLRGTYYYLANGSTNTVDVVLSRNSDTLRKKVSRYPYYAIYKREISSEKYKFLEDGIGYVDMSALQMPDVDKMMKQFENAKGIIIDIRNYPNFLPYVLARRFIKKSKDCINLIEPDFTYPGRFHHRKTITIDPLKNYFKGKVVLLVNEQTQSRAEFSTMLLQAGDNVITVGSQTAGADGNVSDFYFLKDRSILSGTGIFYPDGTETQRKGVKVDIEVKPTIKGIQSGVDEVLQKGIEQIK
ncbi:S41 family peptidase [Flavobacterium poyangense]|uniref:S41 family peptidase n=1 Tax=Flavobacterium poyangense TaxID=2204302 RepID=UPI00141D746B|nr:S41 family peptidase [Flavobacterium sp. JXAS1]